MRPEAHGYPMSLTFISRQSSDAVQESALSVPVIAMK